MSATLAVWMNGSLVGHWRVIRGVHSFRYAPSWLESERVRSLSLSLPITQGGEVKGERVAHFFDNLLPDNDRIRERLRQRFGTHGIDSFSLLQAIGRDCVGAVQLLPDGIAAEGWNELRYEPLSRAKVAQLLVAASTDRLLHQDADAELPRISVAGAQEKTALLKVGRAWALPQAATPTTHILKLPLGIIGGSRQVHLEHSVDNEWLCAEIVRELGLPVAEATVETFDGRRVLAVKRFDREWMDGRRWIARLPQEDFCQALGLPAHKKYEKDGGPGISQAMTLLAGSSHAASDRLAFLLTQLAFWLLAAPDGHAKNFSLFLGRRDSYTLTPLYDILSIWPYIGEGPHHFRWHKAGLSMAIRSRNAHYVFHTVHTRHWHHLAMKYGGVEVWSAMRGMVEQVESALRRVEQRLPRDFPEIIWNTIAHGIRSQVELFQAGLSEVST